jgi:ArsR family transcriptional regulator, arsenate/arsenite/antimonite-responsive transcriptional repressor
MDTTVFEALADSRRLAIVELLASGEHCVCDVSSELGISNALASHHIKKLREVGLVTTRRKGAWLHCRLEEGVLVALAGQITELARRGALVSADCCACAPGKEGTNDD